jgi:hypothetical protein
MDVMECLHPQVRYGEFLPAGQSFEYFWVEVTGRVHGDPAGPHDLARVQDRCRKAVAAGFVEQVVLDLCLLGAILAEGIAGLVFRCWDLGTVTMHPDSAAVQEVVHVPTQGLDQLAGAL